MRIEPESRHERCAGPKTQWNLLVNVLTTEWLPMYGSKENTCTGFYALKYSLAGLVVAAEVSRK